MKRLIQTLRRHKAAGATEYALLVGLIALGAVGAVAATGTEIKGLFGIAETQVAIIDEGAGDPAGEEPGGPNGNGEDPGSPGGVGPTIVAGFDLSQVDDGDVAIFSWEATGATDITATAQYLGSCAAAVAEPTSRALALATFAGDAPFSWTEAVAGCEEQVCVTADSIDGSNEACATIAYAERDTTVNAFAFTPVPDQAKNTIAYSNRALLIGFNGTLPLTLTTANIPADAGGAIITAGGETTNHSFGPSGTLTVSVVPDTEIVLWAAASGTVGETRTMEASIGIPAFTTAWSVTSREPNKAIFTSDGSWSVPDGVTSIEVKLWGGGGGGSYLTGGGGGAVLATVPVIPGDSLSIRVGQGGGNRSNPVAGAGWRPGGHGVSGGGAGGGGASAVSDSTGVLAVAGGGGGAAWGGVGGAGGGAVGEDGALYITTPGGQGGTQSAHGAGGAAAGTESGLPGTDAGGANGIGYAGAGGGGWFSGGSGATLAGSGGGGGGGGSSHIASGSGTLIGGSGQAAGNTGDIDYVTGVGRGGNNGSNGSAGRVVIIW